MAGPDGRRTTNWSAANASWASTASVACVAAITSAARRRASPTTVGPSGAGVVRSPKRATTPAASPGTSATANRPAAHRSSVASSPRSSSSPSHMPWYHWPPGCQPGPSTRYRPSNTNPPSTGTTWGSGPARRVAWASRQVHSGTISRRTGLGDRTTRCTTAMVACP